MHAPLGDNKPHWPHNDPIDEIGLACEIPLVFVHQPTPETIKSADSLLVSDCLNLNTCVEYKYFPQIVLFIVPYR